MIKHSLFNIPDSYYPSWPYQSRALLCIFQQCFKVYITDVVELVTEGLKSELAQGSQSPDIVLRKRADDRQSSLSLWKKQVHPLAYADNAYTHLLRAVTNDPGLMGNGLPASYHGQKSITWFSEQALEAVLKKDTRTVPPFWKSGRAFSVFKMAVQEAETIIGSAVNHPPTRASILDFMTKAASLAKVCNVPWSPNPTGAAGRPFTTVTHTTWVNLGQATSIPRNLHVDPHSVQLNQATQQALALDSQANWSALSISIQDLHTILNRQVLPQEWDLSSMTWPSGPDSSYVKLTYEWVRDHFDATVHLHQTAILVAIIFSKILPDVCHDIKPPNVNLPGDTTQLVRDAPWIPTTSQNRKGMTSQTPFIIMMSTFIIAIYEPTSPLRQYMASHKNNLGQPWTKKHSMFYIISNVCIIEPLS